MKKYILLYLSAIVTVLSILSCGSDSNEPSNYNADDIPETEFACCSMGGDPRGTYSANTPSLISTLANSSSFDFSNKFLFNTGIGSITLEGTSKNSGTYTNNTYLPQIRGKAAVLSHGAEIYSLTFPNKNDTGLFVHKNGTWKIVNKKIRIDEDINKEYGYSVTSKGIFFHTYNRVFFNKVPMATHNTTLALRKQ